MNPQLREIASWRMVSEIVCRYPGVYRVIETHPGGGQYDCLSVRDDRFREVVSINRRGRMFVLGREAVDVWQMLDAGEDVGRVMDEICAWGRPEGWRADARVTAEGWVYRLVADLLASTVFGKDRWACRNGFFDTSGGDCEVLDAFDLFPRAKKRLAVHLPNDVLNQPAYRFWFLFCNDKPVLCLETTGSVWPLKGRVLDLPLMCEKEPHFGSVLARVQKACL